MADVTLDLSVLEPYEATYGLAGHRIEGGRPVTGAPPAENDITGGGFWEVRYGRIMLGGYEKHREWNRIMAHLQSAANRLRVPFQTDIIVPAGITARTQGAWALYDTTVVIEVTAGTLLAGTIFSINHATKSYRCYYVQSIVSVAVNDYTVTIVPPVREAAADNTTCDFSRPECMMRPAPGFRLDWSPYGNFTAEQSLSLIESGW